LIRAETLDNPLTAKCFIYDVTCWPYSFISLNVCKLPSALISIIYTPFVKLPT
jgi:hypothetical protein